MSIDLGKDYVQLSKIMSERISYCEVDKCNAVIKLKKCLQEIKQLSNRIINSDDLMLWDVYELNEQIYQKISEVLDE